MSSATVDITSNSQTEASVDTKAAGNADRFMPTAQKAKYDWYQTETDVVVNVLLKNVKQDQCNIIFNESSLSVTIKPQEKSDSDYSLELDLSHPIVPSKSVFRVLGTKVEVRMRKSQGFHWAKLEGDGTQPSATFAANPSAVASSVPSNGVSNVKKAPKNWDKIAKEADEDDALDGDAAVNKMFQKIYQDADDDVKKAMVKSYTESGGTCLSTDWSDVRKKTCDVKPPDGMEYKQW